MMRVSYPATENRKEMYEKLEQEQPDVVNKQYGDEDELGGPSVNEHPIEFGKAEIDIEKLMGYFGTLERRLNLAAHSLEKISEECEIKSGNPIEGKREEFRELQIQDDEIGPEFIKNVEYFIFAVRTSLENLGHLLNIACGIEAEPTNVNIMTIMDRTDDPFKDRISEAQEEWLSKFNKVRRRLGHHQQFPIQAQISETPTSIEYYKRAIEVTFDGPANRETYPLPRYFEGILENAKELIDDGFGRMNELYDEPSQPDGQPMWDLGIGHEEEK